MRRYGHHKKRDLIRLHIVLESGHRHAMDAERAFHEEATALEKAGCDLLAGITFAKKDRCDPLMVADFLAHTTYMRGESWEPPPPDEDLRYTQEKASLIHLGFDPGGLAEFKASLVDQWNARRAPVSSARLVE
jgi:hypothetical protein